ncbi:hypothetical protein SLS56_011908 [Neofusicoccum ribis]|uniref:AB hydrolase-1 domain-containing protein n=1 Tax=Neofusicoccum ribis TaxID=45134 RepID=A0ABR3SAB5_9PEZI
MISGIVNTLPFSCYKNETDGLLVALAQPLMFGNSSDVARGRIWADTKNKADTCKANGEDIGGLLGTAFVARDMMQIVDVLSKDGLLKYWGISYGATLGATVAAMFPDRMDKVILDSVYNPHEYFNGQSFEMWKITDMTLSHFVSQCVEAGERCALADLNATTTELEESLYSLLETIKYNPIPFDGAVIDYVIVKNMILQALYAPRAYPKLAARLHGLLTQNETQYADIFAAAAIAPAFDSWPGIECADKTARASRKEDTFPWLDKMEQTSKLGGDIKTNSVMLCSQWPFESKERYLGDFNVKTKNPVLTMGNKWDPVTTFLSAQNISAGFEGSVALEIRGAGVSTLSLPQVAGCQPVVTYYSMDL